MKQNRQIEIAFTVGSRSWLDYMGFVDFFSRNFKTCRGRCGKHGVKFHLQLFAKLSINPEVVQFMINYICKENTLLSYFCHISCNVSGFNAIFGLFILSFFHFDSQKRILIGVQTLLV